MINTESSVLERAEEVQEKLGDIFPSFMKQMLRSHVTSGFLLVSTKKLYENFSSPNRYDIYVYAFICDLGSSKAILQFAFTHG